MAKKEINKLKEFALHSGQHRHWPVLVFAFFALGMIYILFVKPSSDLKVLRIEHQKEEQGYIDQVQKKRDEAKRAEDVFQEKIQIYNDAVGALNSCKKEVNGKFGDWSKCSSLQCIDIKMKSAQEGNKNCKDQYPIPDYPTR